MKPLVTHFARPGYEHLAGCGAPIIEGHGRPHVKGSGDVVPWSHATCRRCLRSADYNLAKRLDPTPRPPPPAPASDPTPRAQRVYKWHLVDPHAGGGIPAPYVGVTICNRPITAGDAPYGYSVPAARTTDDPDEATCSLCLHRKPVRIIGGGE